MAIASDWRREGIGPSHTLTSTSVSMEMEAGPSRLPYSEIDQVGSIAAYASGQCGCVDCAEHTITAQRPRRSRRRWSSRSSSNISMLSSILPPFLLPFIPLTSAAPAPAPAPPPTRTDRTIARPTISLPLVNPSHPPYLKRVQYLTSVSTPSILPTQATYVDETVLPYLLAPHSEGGWRRAEGGWSLYGRQGATPSGGPIFASDDDGGDPDDPAITKPASYAVESVLPNGWGVSSNRTSIYKVPLISIASVIISMVIVAFIVFVVLGRRKRHRKEKRAKERLRRKALAAAGLKEDQLGGHAADAAFKEKLAELEKNHLAKKKRGGQAGIAVGKVRGWNQRMNALRRRRGKGKGKEEEVTIEVIDEDGDGQQGEDKPVDGLEQGGPASLSSVLDRDSPVRERPSSIGSTRSSRDEPRDPVCGEQEIQPSDLVTHNHEQNNAIDGSITQPGQTSAPYFPPAYRPASVRSLPRQNASSSSAGPSRVSRFNTDTSPPTVLSGAEKTQAPGYYPAPATEAGEIALAVASRSDGKARIVDSPDEVDEHREERTRHIATDDKNVLERMRLGASAPPATGRSSFDHEHDGEEGPSAPTVRIDDQGFEQLEEGDLSLQSILDNAGPSAAPPSNSTATSAFPPPPTLTQHYSSHRDGLPSNPLMPLNENHLLPSAPPVLPPIDLSPSAPPMLGEEDEVGTQPDAESHAPSAPIFELSDEDESDLSEQLDEDVNPVPIERGQIPHGSLDSHAHTNGDAPWGTRTEGDELPANEEQIVGSLEQAHTIHQEPQSEGVTAGRIGGGSGTGIISRSNSETGPLMFLPRYEP